MVYPEIMVSNPENFRMGQIVKKNFWKNLIVKGGYIIFEDYEYKERNK